jgi:isoleucyl-tRNA synthetase
VVRAVNDLRKDRGLDISDRILLHLDGDDRVLAAVAAHRDWVAGEVLASSLTVGDEATGASDRPAALDIDGAELSAHLAVATA